jgi:hypothetical protein
MSRPNTQSNLTPNPTDLLDQTQHSSPDIADNRLLSALTRIEQRLQALEDNQKLLTSRFETLASDPPIVTSTSFPSITYKDMDAFLTTKFNDTYQTTLDSFGRLSASVAELKNPHTTLSPTSSSIIRTLGFFQKESKDFHVSKLVKLLTDEKLGDDSLQDLELFFDGILATFNTVALTNDLYPKYRDLPKTFDLNHHLCQLNRTIPPSVPDQHQAEANFKSFGASLCRFLLNPATVSQTTCPNSYLQLLSLQNEPDGFLILKNFTFLRSPQLDGKNRDFRSAINSLIIHNDEHICTFYSHAIWLH